MALRSVAVLATMLRTSVHSGGMNFHLGSYDIPQRFMAAAYDILSLSVDNDYLEKIMNHGCWCARLNPDISHKHLGGITTIDRLDRLCRSWANARQCNSLSGGTCETGTFFAYRYTIEPENNSTDMLSCRWSCMLNKSRCLKDSCILDAHFVHSILGFIEESGDSWAPVEVSHSKCYGQVKPEPTASGWNTEASTGTTIETTLEPLPAYANDQAPVPEQSEDSERDLAYETAEDESYQYYFTLHENELTKHDHIFKRKIQTILDDPTSQRVLILNQPQEIKAEAAKPKPQQTPPPQSEPAAAIEQTEELPSYESDYFNALTAEITPPSHGQPNTKPPQEQETTSSPPDDFIKFEPISQTLIFDTSKSTADQPAKRPQKVCRGRVPNLHIVNLEKRRENDRKKAAGGRPFKGKRNRG